MIIEIAREARLLARMVLRAIKGRASVMSTGEAPVSDSCQLPDVRNKLRGLGLPDRKGMFVEVGGFDGDSFSNTSFLADQGWTGVYIEPVPKFYRLLRARHVFNKVHGENCGIASGHGTAVISMMGALSTMNEATAEAYQTISWAQAEARAKTELTIETRPISDVLAKNEVPTDFELMVVDVEGGEEPIIVDLLQTCWRPRVLIIELCDVHPDFKDKPMLVASHARVRDMLIKTGYTESYVDEINTIFHRVQMS